MQHTQLVLVLGADSGPSGGETGAAPTELRAQGHKQLPCAPDACRPSSPGGPGPGTHSQTPGQAGWPSHQLPPTHPVLLSSALGGLSQKGPLNMKHLKDQPSQTTPLGPTPTPARFQNTTT